jgi:hypothetical protein
MIDVLDTTSTTNSVQKSIDYGSQESNTRHFFAMKYQPTPDYNLQCRYTTNHQEKLAPFIIYSASFDISHHRY